MSTSTSHNGIGMPKHLLDLKLSDMIWYSTEEIRDKVNGLHEGKHVEALAQITRVKPELMRQALECLQVTLVPAHIKVSDAIKVHEEMHAKADEAEKAWNDHMKEVCEANKGLDNDDPKRMPYDYSLCKSSEIRERAGMMMRWVNYLQEHNISEKDPYLALDYGRSEWGKKGEGKVGPDSERRGMSDQPASKSEESGS